MPRFDVYCVICGAPHSVRWFCPEGWVTEEDLPFLSQMSWLGNTSRILGENHHASSTNKVFISGPATYVDAGVFKVEPGTDPNFPTENQVQYRNGRARIKVFDYERSIDFAIPIHEPCYQLLKKVLIQWGLQRTAHDVDNGILYKTLMKFADEASDDRTRLTRMNYGENSGEFDAVLSRSADSEHILLNPMESSKLVEYFQQPLLPMRDQQNRYPPRTGSEDFSGCGDPFANLAPELLFLIMIRLPVVSLEALRHASPAAARLDLDSGFWKQKVRHNMPWIFDLPEEANDRPGHKIDWLRVYTDLENASELDGEGAYIGVLKNRRRIWETCEDIAGAFEKLQKENSNHKNREKDSIVENAVTSLMQPFARPLPACLETVSLPFVKNISDIQQNLPLLSFFWSKEGILSGLGRCDNLEKEKRPEQTIGHEDRFDVRDDVKIKHGDWIAGFVLSFRDEYKGEGTVEKEIVGVKIHFLSGMSHQLGNPTPILKIFHARDNLLLVGIMAQLTMEGQIVSLSLLQAPASNLCPHSEELGRRQSQILYAHSNIGSKMWKNELPPQDIIAGEVSLVQFTPSLPVPTDPVAMEALVFGKDESELAAITEIIGDTQLQGIKIRYSDRPPKSIGPHSGSLLDSQPQSIKIDGQGGERIIALEGVFGIEWLNALRFVTNRNRSLVLGHNHIAMQNKLYPPGEGMVLRGVYGAWAETMYEEVLFEAVGGLFSLASPQFPSLDVHEPEVLGFGLDG
ncbi:uncharacterized protein N7498_000290 [Penicillium cinerascens]|uniref:F-box domain-containing protein n=1 Tax=Penicillium cinerascens TaxID=70096 RepID=A0A9W9NE42_9EURO|nr:uncharacterized protein N7498_000290 [Penicillium cinerascens]KAJ5218191.1 hypothetical protein N7498_000290 [Penicillium cinerascens]